MSAVLHRQVDFSSCESSTLESIKQAAQEVENYTIRMRHALHKIPELSWHEVKTIAFLKKEIHTLIDKSNLRCKFSEYKGGLVVDLFVEPFLPTVLFRADIDALPIKEETGLPFSSKHPGLMHACGHDCHAAMLLGAFKMLMEGKVTARSNIRFVWQRAEECVKSWSGGKSMVEEGVCDVVDYVYGLHISSLKERGVFFSCPDIMMSNASHFDFEIECSGGHVMHPEVGSNAINILSDIHNGLRGFEGLSLGPGERVALVPSICRAGDAANIRPNYGRMCYSFRNFLSEEGRMKFIESVHAKIVAIIAAYPTAKLATFQFYPGYPVLSNNPASYHKSKRALEEGGERVKSTPVLFSGEDFAYFLEKKRGAFWVLGARQEPAADHHSPTFNPDETVLWQGVHFWLLLANAHHPVN